MQHLVKSARFKTVILIIFFILSAIIWFALWRHGKYYISTNNAYLNANVVQISPRITGKVNKLYVTNNQFVQAGDPLIDLDPALFEAALESAKAQIQLHEAELEKAESIAKRMTKLVKTRYASPQEGDNATALLHAANASLAIAQAACKQANLNLMYTKITAPVSGWISNLSVRTGNVASANQPLFALISNEEFWVDANFKETEMMGVKRGQKVLIMTDLYPKRPFKGVVESISRGTGSVFSLLPPQNATGNWVKITQRIPVKIRVLNPDDKYPLRIGISANVTVKLQEFINQATVS